MDASQHGLVLNKYKTGVRMREDVDQLGIRDIGAARHIGSSGEKNSIVGKNPLQAVVGEESDMLARLYSQADKGCRQIEAPLVGFAKAERNEGARLVLSAEPRKPVVAKGGIRVDLAKSGSVFEIRRKREFIF